MRQLPISIKDTKELMEYEAEIKDIGSKYGVDVDIIIRKKERNKSDG